MYSCPVSRCKRTGGRCGIRLDNDLDTLSSPKLQVEATLLRIVADDFGENIWSVLSTKYSPS